MLCNGDYTKCKYERANLPCSPLCNCEYINTVGITNELATSDALIVTGFTKTVLIGTRNEIHFIADY